ncbi:MAG: hypothetical protein U9N14_06365, partial [Pseudomonadota bacterium]|nr:hypothetical protein [Pseudomonadota bacterium]
MTINSISKSVLATALLCVMVPVAFAADVIDVKTVSSWGTPVAILQQDAFAYCSVENSYDNGMRLIFARNALGRTNIAIGFPDARLKVGSSYPLHLSVDDRLSRDVFGTALAADVLVIPTQDDDDLYQAIRRGMYMRIDGSDDSISFHLAGTSRALAALGRCVTVEVAKSPAPPPVQAPVAFVPTVAPVPVPPAETVVVERSGSGGMRAPMVETADLESALPPVEEPAVVAPDPVVIESIESVETEEPVVVEEPMETVVIAIEEDVQVETATRMPIAPVAEPIFEPEPVAEPAAVPEPVAAPMLEPEPVA